MTIYAIRNCYFPIETRSNGPKSCVEFGRAHTRKEGEGAKTPTLVPGKCSDDHISSATIDGGLTENATKSLNFILFF